MISLEQLRAICKTSNGRAECEKYQPHLVRLMPEYGIDSPARVAAFIAQIAHESSDFTRLTENLNYSAQGLAGTWPNRFRTAQGQPNAHAHALHRRPEAIANAVYCNRMGNGPEASGDGWKYRGRGLKQLTGKDNYRACGEALDIDLVAHPELLEEPQWAVASACWFWRTNGCSPLADRGNFSALTRKINGGLIGLAEREAYWERAKAVLRMEGQPA